jgi:hypothetical protein
VGACGHHSISRKEQLDIITKWLIQAGSGQGLTAKKILDSSALDLSSLPPNWPRLYAAARLHELICDTARQLPDPDSRVVLTALNQFLDVSGASLTERFMNLCNTDVSKPKELVLGQWRNVAQRWRQLRPQLAQRIIDEIQQRAVDGWEEYASATPALGSPELQPFVVDRLEVTYFFDESRVCTHTTTQRWLSVDLADAYGMSSIDHYKVRARYTDSSGRHEDQGTVIRPMLNCRPGRTEVGRDGWLMTEMQFPEPRRDGEQVFFASQVDYSASTPMDPFALIQVTSHGILYLIMRVQFPPNAAPKDSWVYSGPSAADARVAPRGGDRDRRREPNLLGYVEHVAEYCPAGWYYTIGWEWE